MKQVRREQFTFRFAADVPPVLTVEPGEMIAMESYDTTLGRVRRPEDVHTYAKDRDPHKVNPAAGPVYVAGAEPGDTLVVEILAIELDAEGSLRIMPGGMGVLAGEVEATYCRIVRVEGDRIVFDAGPESARGGGEPRPSGPILSFPARPMVGVVATAPAAGEITTAMPGDVGSNMDHADITVGTKVYLPVQVRGALFGVGDLHASMGDGEVTGNAVEIGGRTTVRVDLIKGRQWARPWLETETDWMTTATGPTLEAAIKVAVRDMVALLAERLGVSREDAYLLVSATGDVRIGQACGGLPPTVRVKFPKLGR